MVVYQELPYVQKKWAFVDTKGENGGIIGTPVYANNDRDVIINRALFISRTE